MRRQRLLLIAVCGKSLAPLQIKRNAMFFLNANNFLDRQKAAANARKAQAEKFLARPKYDPNDPAIIEREAKRRAVIEARGLRAAQRQALKTAAEAARAAKLAAEEVA